MNKITLEGDKIFSAIKPLGRAQRLSGGLGCDHSGTGFELCAITASDICVDILVTKEKDFCDFLYFTVYIDKERLAERFCAPVGEQSLIIPAPTDGKPHIIRVVKQNESNYNLCEIRRICFEGELLDAPLQNEKYIEYIGDSLSCGMGLLGKKGAPNPQTSLWEDVTQGYTYTSAQALGADCSIVSESGIGLAGSWFDPLFDFYSAYSYKRDKNLKYDFARIPDLLVINLGTNDFYLNCDLGICALEEVEQGVKDFINFVRGAYGREIPILWVARFMRIGEAYVGAIDRAIEALSGESAKIYRLDVPTFAGGAQGHPDIEGHRTARDAIVAYIKEKNLLK